jgi:hypothetical protein
MIRCPQCGNDEMFAIDVVVQGTAYVTQCKEEDGVYTPGNLEITGTHSRGPIEWDAQSICHCGACAYWSLLSAFTLTTGGDAA